MSEPKPKPAPSDKVMRDRIAGFAAHLTRSGYSSEQAKTIARAAAIKEDRRR